MQDEFGSSIAGVFKPSNEEPMAISNPKGLPISKHREGLKRGTKVGEGALREVAALLLDHKADGEMGKKLTAFAGFPLTVLEVHKIAILDIRLANTDRNGVNILACKEFDDSDWILVPIDHGYCLPDTMRVVHIEWLYWPQEKLPFQLEALKYISVLDADADILLLEKHGE
ncbi:hypothetical protein L7F22_049752 [Adiantum nelumboides]|nr:hypothetical protein [Adiantum nelumboides]